MIKINFNYLKYLSFRNKEMSNDRIAKKIRQVSRLSDPKLQHYFDTESLKSLHEIKLYADDLYYNQGKSTGFSDWQYDMLKDTLIQRDPTYIVPVGAKIREGENRVKLPYWLGSMDKFKPSDTRKIERWLSQNEAKEYIIEDKLDGVSCLIVIKKGKIKLYTRGNGVIGADISYLAQYFKTIPKGLKVSINLRGELVMPIETFKKKYSDKSNPRNMVAGCIGAKTIRPGLQDIQFIAYEIVGDGKMNKPSEQLKYLEELGFTTVRHKVVNAITVEDLMSTLVHFKETSPYEIDGLIVQPDKTYARNKSGNPKYAFAFKMRLTSNLVKARVVRVLWRVSKWGQLKPRVEIKPTKLGGVTVTYATGFNAKFIKDNKLGPGAVIELTRSGDVIPYIVSVIKPANNPQMPSPPCVWKWNDTGVDILAVKDCGEICTKLIHSFLQQMGFKHLGERTVIRMYEGGIDSILRILLVTNKELRSIGFGAGEAKVIHNSIKLTLSKGMDLGRMLGASGVFGPGVGKKRVTTLLKSIPNILVEERNMTRKEVFDRVVKIEGFSDKTASIVAKNIAWAARFAQAIGYLTDLRVKGPSNGVLKGYTVVISGTLSGYTRAQAKEAVEAVGGKMGNKVKRPNPNLKQIVVIVGPPTTSKAKDAAKYGIKTYNEEQFLRVLDEGIP